MEYFINHCPKSSIIAASFKRRNKFYLRRHSRSIVQKRRVTVVLIFCLFLALLLWTPQTLSLTYEILIESYSDMSYEHRIILLVFNNFANLFLCINASIDFILYCFLSEKFAQTCRQIIFRQCSNPNSINRQRPHLFSPDRASVIIENTSNNFHQQQFTAERPNKYYAQLYEFYRNSSGIDSNQSIKWRDKMHQSNSNSVKSDRQICYPNQLLENIQQLRDTEACNRNMNIILNPIINFIDDDDDDVHLEIDGSMNTLPMNSTETVFSEIKSNI